MIVPGTGILDDFGERPTGMPFDVFNWCLAARLMGTRIAFVSIGAGPIGNRLSRWLMTSAARMANYRSYRDTASRKFMESVGFDTSRDAMYPDLAFKLPVPQSTTAEPSRQLTVGVGVMTYRGWYAFDKGGQEIFDIYVAKMARFVTHLLSRGYHVRLITGDRNDAPAVEAIMAALGEEDTRRLSSEPVHSLYDVFWQVGRTELVVATRFHNVVAALMAGKPVTSLGYAPKNDLLLGAMGLGEFCQHSTDSTSTFWSSSCRGWRRTGMNILAQSVAGSVSSGKPSNFRTNTSFRPSSDRHFRSDKRMSSKEVADGGT